MAIAIFVQTIGSKIVEPQLMSKELLTKSRNCTFCQKYCFTNRVIATAVKITALRGSYFQFRQNARFSNFVTATIVQSRASKISWPQWLSKVVLQKSRNYDCYLKHCFEHLVSGIYMHIIASKLS